jgi:hypothetical protein
MVFTLIKKSEQTANTFDALLRIFAWSMNICLRGTTPATDWLDRPIGAEVALLASGWRGALTLVKGDWAFYKEVFYFPAWNGATEMCWLCRASSTNRDLLWTDVREEAGWRNTFWTHELYLAHRRAQGLAIPILLLFCAGLRLECISIDTLHIVDLGLTAHIVGNVLWLFTIIRNVFRGRTNKERINLLEVDLRKWEKEHPSSSSKIQGKLNQDRIRTEKQWPKMKAKGAALRHVTAYVLHLAVQFCNGSRYDNLVLSLCQLICRFYELISRESQFLTSEALKELPVIGHRLAEAYTTLSSLSFSAGFKLFKMMPKLHLWEHLTEYPLPLNPRAFWCYSDEDLMGALVAIAVTCHSSTLASTALFKWLHLAFG